MTSTRDTEDKVAGWEPGRRVEAHVVFITEELDYGDFDAWRAKAGAWEQVEVNNLKVIPTLQWGSSRRPMQYIAVDMRVNPSIAAVISWKRDLVTDATAWFANLVAVTLETWPDLTFERVGLEIR